MSHQVKIFDSSLRDGAQAGGVSFSVEDKLKIVKSLDRLGVSYIEAGNPGSNFKDLEFFKRVKEINLKTSKLTAFGSTRRKNISVKEDENVQSLLTANTEVVAIFGKAWDFHVTDIIKTSLEENLRMIEETIRFLKEKGKEVIFDAEHFFDGYKENPAYALAVLKVARDGGADCLALCDTNGGAFPNEVYEVTKKVVETFPAVSVGIHCHNDCGMAVANSIMAVEGGANHVQGTYIGLGERCGNTNISTIIPNLQIKKGFFCIPKENIVNLTATARYVAEITNVTVEASTPYIGNSAFAHKGGMHIDGVKKASHSFEHMQPEDVGNKRRFLMSEVSGKTTILPMIQKIDKDLTKNSSQTQELIDELKRLEHIGYQFEGAESSFELVMRKYLGKYKPFFEVNYYKVIEEEPARNAFSSSALIKVRVDGKEEMTATEGNGPVNALDKALRKALEVFYPSLKAVHLTDYKVRVLNAEEATGAKVRVLIESTDGKELWSTVGVSTNIVEASMIALADSIEYKLIKDLEESEGGENNGNDDDTKDISSTCRA
ncbi:citramalate synthase [Marinisporobacter balticus]|uniref:Citramalate synthase n=1 Tax=Marinisporobacter balticus TaxID=2018667 RepID=A0A4R2KHL8_9FIRM|nr:citramalate synthase [Marinisporobacter balticus]TCO73103.1 2-isopropylmalate synthase [Marinisporobacter balticus]